MSTVSLEMTHLCDYCRFLCSLKWCSLHSLLHPRWGWLQSLHFYEMPSFLPLASKLNTAVLIIICEWGLFQTVVSRGNNTDKPLKKAKEELWGLFFFTLHITGSSFYLASSVCRCSYKPGETFPQKLLVTCTHYITLLPCPARSVLKINETLETMWPVW